MPIIKSAKKRVKIAAKARARNLHTRRELRWALKAYAAALESGKPAEVAKAQAAAMSALDTAAKKAIIHKNKAARFKSRLASQTKAAGVKAISRKPPRTTSKAKANTTAKKATAAQTTTSKK